MYRGCSEDGIEVAMNMIFHKYEIKIEAYHGVHINGVCIRCLIADYKDIIHEIFILLKVCSKGYVTDENFEQVFIIHEKLLCQIDGDLSCLRKVDPNR